MTTEIEGAAGAAAEHGPTAGEYIVHHLGHNSAHHQGIVDFTNINYDTILWSILMAVVTAVFLIAGSRRMQAGVPGRFQGLVEWIAEMVEDQSKSIVHGNRRRSCPDMRAPIDASIPACISTTRPTISPS